MAVGGNKADSPVKVPALIIVCRTVPAHFIGRRKVRIGTAQDFQAIIASESGQGRPKTNGHELDKPDIDGQRLREFCQFYDLISRFSQQYGVYFDVYTCFYSSMECLKDDGQVSAAGNPSVLLGI